MEWFPWFSAYYRSKTLHLTLEQDALYRRLIDHYMETRAPIPDNDQALARICAVDIECIRHALSILRAFFTPKNGLLFHDFCDNQLDIQDKKSKIRSDISQKAAKARWKKNEQNQSDECIEHASMHASDDASMDATRQDITRQDKERIPPKPPKISAPEIQMKFETIWNAYPGIGKDGLIGSGFKGSKEKARQIFTNLLKKENDHDNITNRILEALGRYERHLAAAGYPSKHCTTWLNQRGWEDDYSSIQGLQSPRNTNSGQAKPYSHMVIDAAERAKQQLRLHPRERFDPASALAAINGSGNGTCGIPQAPRLAIDDHRIPETPVNAQTDGSK